MSVIVDSNGEVRLVKRPGMRCGVCQGEMEVGEKLFHAVRSDGYREPVCEDCEEDRRDPVTGALELRGSSFEMPNGPARVLSQPLTYQAQLIRDTSPGGWKGFRAKSIHGSRSYVRDLSIVAAAGNGYRGEEWGRLKQHEKELRVLSSERERRLAPGATYEFEQRTVNWTNGTGGYFAPPAWLVQYFAEVPVAERVVTAKMPTFDLPDGVQSVNIPGWTAGGNAQTQPLNSASGSAPIADYATSSAVTTIAGTEDIALQMLEQSPVGAHFDWVTFSNMESQYGGQLETLIYIGAGSQSPQGSGNNQILGILNNTLIPAANIITYTDGSPTVKNLIQTSAGTDGGPAAQAIAAIGNNRKLPPEMWTARTSRGAWITSGEITLPIAVSDQPEPGVFDLLSYPLWPSDAVPNNLGAGANQDILACWRPSDWLLLESEPRTNVYTDVLSGDLVARMQLRRYVAVILRQPSSVSYITGTGMVVQSGF